MSETGFFVFLSVFITAVLIAPMSYSSGVNTERARLYEKCLEQNSQETHEKAVSICKKFVEVK
jgi:hypothetical protein